MSIKETKKYSISYRPYIQTAFSASQQTILCIHKCTDFKLTSAMHIIYLLTYLIKFNIPFMVIISANNTSVTKTCNGQQCKVSSPAGESRWNSCDLLPPITPELAATATENQASCLTTVQSYQNKQPSSHIQADALDHQQILTIIILTDHLAQCLYQN